MTTSRNPLRRENVLLATRAALIVALRKLPEAKNAKSNVAMVRETTRLFGKLQVQSLPSVVYKYMEEAAQ